MSYWKSDMSFVLLVSASLCIVGMSRYAVCMCLYYMLCVCITCGTLTMFYDQNNNCVYLCATVSVCLEAVAMCHRCEGDQVAVLHSSCCDWSSCKVSICLDFLTEEINLLPGLTEPCQWFRPFLA